MTVTAHDAEPAAPAATRLDPARARRLARAACACTPSLTRELDEELRRAHGLPLSSYDVLVNLESAPDRQMRMSELADAVLLSRSGLTRLVERLERDGLLARADCPGDARGSLAVLTDAGLARLARRARPTCAACASASSTLRRRRARAAGRVLAARAAARAEPDALAPGRGAVPPPSPMTCSCGGRRCVSARPEAVPPAPPVGR